MRVLIFGTGSHVDNLLKKLGVDNTLQYGWQNEIIGFLDNNKDKSGKIFYGKSIYHTSELKHLEYDVIVISSIFHKEIKDQLIYGFEVPADTIKDDIFLLQRKMYFKYANSENDYIQETLKYWKKNKISYFNQYDLIASKEKINYEVFWDIQECMPFVIFENKKMYYPRNWKFEVKNGKQYVSDILYEQKEGSPHLYLNKNHQLKQGGVIVDAGVGEGNFALRYIDIVSKVYLIENYPEWIKPLKLTFRPYMDKVVFCSKKLSSTCGLNECTLDSLIGTEEKIDFIKMDIEGDEISALMGARRVFKENNLKCSICTYHRKGDEHYIKEILESYGYQTSFSDGFMVLMHDSNIYDYADFRKGVIYGAKN